MKTRNFRQIVLISCIILKTLPIVDNDWRYEQKQQSEDTLKNISDFGRVRISRKGETVFAQREFGSTNVTFAKHGKFRGGPGVVGPTIATINFLHQLGRKINLHLLLSFFSGPRKLQREKERDFGVCVWYLIWCVKTPRVYIKVSVTEMEAAF